MLPWKKLTQKKRAVWLAEPEAGVNHTFVVNGEGGAFSFCGTQCFFVRFVSLSNCLCDSYGKHSRGWRSYWEQRNKMESSVFLETGALRDLPLLSSPILYNRTPGAATAQGLKDKVAPS